MASIPLDTLPTFVAVAHARGMRAAAEALHLTHSAVSQQIRGLEQRLGFDLFLREGRRLVLTDAGRHLLAAAQGSIAQLEQARIEAAWRAQGAEQLLRVAIVPSFGQRWLMPRMGRWRERHPRLRLDLVASQQMADLPAANLHLAIRHGSGQWRGLRAERLLLSPRVVVGSPKAASRIRAAGPGALADQPLLGHASLWRSWFAAAGIACRAEPVATFNDAGMLLQAVEADIGLGLVRDVLAADALLDGRLVQLSNLALPEIPPHDGYDSTALWLAWREDLSDWPAVQAFRAWLRDEMRASRERLDARAAPPAA